MNLWKWLIRTLVFDRRIGLGIMLGAAAAAAVLTGSLLVGDSVRLSLAYQNRLRLGRVGLVLSGRQTLFRAQLAAELSDKLNQPAAAVLLLNGWAERADGTARARHVSVIGVDESFGRLGPSERIFRPSFLEEGLVLNQALAARLNVSAGDEVVLTFEKVGGLSAESVLFPEEELLSSIRLPVSAVAEPEAFGNFSLLADSAGTLNVFVSRRELSRWIGQPDLVNAVLLPEECRLETAERMLRETFAPADVGLLLQLPANSKGVQVQSRRVFIQESISDCLLAADADAVGILTYFVNEITKDGRSCPYSLVSSVGSANLSSLNPFSLLADDEIIINSWLADDLEADVGDRLTLRYFVPDAGGRLLTEESASFRVCAVIPMEGLGADSSLMPAFPQLAEVENCREWKPGIPIDLGRIRPKDETYWDRYRGAPKAFISLPAAQRIWGGRFGNLTAVRYSPAMTPERLAENLRACLNPAAAGLTFEPVGQRARQASVGTTDFGSLFFGMSLFLLVSSLLLTALLFRFAVERRSRQIGLLKALGFRRRRIWLLFLLEGFVLSAAGSCLGIILAIGYTQLLIWGLRGVWSWAVAGAPIDLNFHLSTLAGGAAAGVVISLLSMAAALRWWLSQPPVFLLSGTAEITVPHKRAGWLPASVVLLLAGLGLVGWGLQAGIHRASAVFFVSGVLLLGAFLSFVRYVLSASAWFFLRGAADSLFDLACRNASRRPGRSMGVAAMTAAGVFLVTAVGLNQKSLPTNILDRRNAAGGFVLLAESGLPILENLEKAAVRYNPDCSWSLLGLKGAVAFRLQEGEPAGCLNLNRARQPRLLGVDPAALAQRGAFSFQEVLPGTAETPEDAWHLLDVDWGPDIVPAVGDVATVYWALGLKVGDMLLQQDEQGRSFSLKIVAMLKPSVLQGNLLISEKAFLKRFGSTAGYRVFLIDAVPEKAEHLSAALSRTFRRWGLEVVSTRERLALFQSVENTYLSVFLVLGGLGLLLGTVGMGWILWLNILDRRGELAMMQAVGFRQKMLAAMLVQEHTLLLAGGVLGGMLTAMPAVLPALAGRIEPAPAGMLLAELVLIVFSGWLWIHLAASAALAGPLLKALRNE